MSLVNSIILAFFLYQTWNLCLMCKLNLLTFISVTCIFILHFINMFFFGLFFTWPFFLQFILLNAVDL